MSQYAGLAARIRESLAELTAVVDRVAELCGKALRTGDDGYWDGVALNLHGYYTGLERIFEDVTRTMEEGMPSGRDWHQDLLIQLSSEIASIRPPVIGRATRHCLDEYRGFRHVVRSVYAFRLRPARLRELAEGLPACYTAVTSDLVAFAVFLEQAAPSGQPLPG